jgi:acyl carrier protein
MERDKIKSIVIDELVNASGMEASSMTEDTQLENDLGLDSIDGVELVMNLEKSFGITIFDDDLSDIKEKTVRDLVEFIETKIS